MSFPPILPLRQPKSVIVTPKNKEKKKWQCAYVILTLNNDKKLVVPSDAYHGILKYAESAKCVFCKVELDINIIEKHKTNLDHCKNAKEFPHVSMYGENLVRQLTETEFYCTLCNAEISKMMVDRHISNDSHKDQLEMALRRVSVYKPAEK